MALVSEELKVCGIKIISTVDGVEGVGSGVLYLTPNRYHYNYVLTAKHVFQEDSNTDYSPGKIGSVQLFYNDKGTLVELEYIPKRSIKDKLIVFKEDLAIIIVNKNNSIPFRQILVSDELDNADKDFMFWSVFKANENELQQFQLQRSDSEVKRFKLHGTHLPDYLPGMSGAGVFIQDKNILYGVINKYPNKAFQNAAIDCTLISFSDINNKLVSLNRVPLDTNLSHSKREIGNEVIDIHQVYINNVCLDLALARKRLSVDIVDDWYHDPLKYVDLLNQDYLFDEFTHLFGTNEFKASLAEEFYVPKRKFTLRLGLLSPFLDRIMYLACVGVLAESLDHAMIPNVFSARYNRFQKDHLILNGVEQWKKMRYKLADLASEKLANGNFSYGCVIEIDLLNFYDNISKNLLYTKIQRVCANENEQNAALLLKDILFKISKKDVGLPQNSDASSLLASFYLNQVDVLMHHYAPTYFRFMDDIRIFCKDKFEARRILQIFEFELRRCYLSVNSQKTEIRTLVETEEDRADASDLARTAFNGIFDMQVAKIARLRKSRNHVNLNEAFHQCIDLLKDKLIDGDDAMEDTAKKVNYAFNSLAVLAVKGINLTSKAANFKEVLLHTTESLKEKPWITSDVCKVLNLLPSEEILDFLPFLKEIILNNRFNTYSFQTYHIWLLLAKHKYFLSDLTKYAVEQIEKNDDTNRPVIAAMIIYMCSVDMDFRRVILRKIDDGFTHQYFQSRMALIAVRSFETNLIQSKNVHPTLKMAHKYLHRYADKALTYIPGFDEDDQDEDDFIDQMYSV